MVKQILSVAYFLSYVISVQAQLSLEQEAQIDSQFLEWNTPNHPGGAIGVYQNGNPVYRKAFGLASLEYLVPNNPNTIFNLASVSKQFTAMAMVILEQRGQLHLEDDIRLYLPEMPIFESTITIRQMLHHTSGMRSLHALLGMAGWRGDDMRSNPDLYRFMEKQKELNFTPGEEYLYCNTGFMLAAKIVEEVTDTLFAHWMHHNIFHPLNMIDTYVEDEYDRVVTQNATSYYQDDQNYSRAIDYWNYVGSGNMHSTIDDLAKWMQFLMKPPAAHGSTVQRMFTHGRLNNGGELAYCLGISEDEFQGNRRYVHGGSIGGFRTTLQGFPDKNLSIVILTNFSGGNPGSHAAQIAGLLLQDLSSSETAQKPSSQPIQRKDIEKWLGKYWNVKQTGTRSLVWEDDKLYFQFSPRNRSELLATGPGQFTIPSNPSMEVTFGISNKTPSITVEAENEPTRYYEMFEPWEIGMNEPSISGRYYSPELDTHYDVIQEEGKWMVYHARHGKLSANLRSANILESDYPMNWLVFEQNPYGEVIGCRASNGRARHVWFEKQPLKN